MCRKEHERCEFFTLTSTWHRTETPRMKKTDGEHRTADIPSFRTEDGPGGSPSPVLPQWLPVVQPDPWRETQAGSRQVGRKMGAKNACYTDYDL